MEVLHNVNFYRLFAAIAFNLLFFAALFFMLKKKVKM